MRHLFCFFPPPPLPSLPSPSLVWLIFMGLWCVSFTFYTNALDIDTLDASGGPKSPDSDYSIPHPRVSPHRSQPHIQHPYGDPSRPPSARTTPLPLPRQPLPRKPVPFPPIPLPCILHIRIWANHPCMVILYTETTTDEVGDPKSGTICKHAAGTTVQQWGQ